MADPGRSRGVLRRGLDAIRPQLGRPEIAALGAAMLCVAVAATLSALGPVAMKLLIDALAGDGTLTRTNVFWLTPLFLLAAYVDLAPSNAAGMEATIWSEEGGCMARKRYSPEDIIGKLRSAEVWLAEGVSVGEVVRRLGVQRVTYYRWRKEYGGMGVDQARRLKELEAENARLKKAVADLTLDKMILAEAASGNF